MSKTTLIFDIETTGLIKLGPAPLDLQPFIIEFCGVLIDEKFNQIAKLDFVVNPGRRISEEITRITGLKNEDVEKGLPTEKALSKIMELIERADKVVAHNIAFDAKVIDFEAKRFGKKIKWPQKVCTVEATEHFRGFRMNLGALYEYCFGDTFPNAHRASNDVKALLKVYKHLKAMGKLK